VYRLQRKVVLIHLEYQGQKVQLSPINAQYAREGS